MRGISGSFVSLRRERLEHFDAAAVEEAVRNGAGGLADRNPEFGS